MTKPVEAGTSARREIRRYVAHYEDESPGLGERLVSDIEAATALIAEYPSIGERVRRIRDVVRRVPLRRFPFLLIYRERASDIQIIALAHTSRRPNYWRSRLADE